MSQARGRSANQQGREPRPSRVSLVVGGSGGIGAAVADRLGRRGDRVAVAFARGRTAAERVVGDVAARGGEAAAFGADVRSEEGCRGLVRAVCERWGRLDILVYAAGVDLYKLAVDTDASEWRQVMAVNLEGAFYAAKAALPGMIRRGWGRIVHIGSIWGEVGAAHEAAYAAAKAGLTGLTKSLAKEVARTGVTVNAVAPGVIETPMNDRFSEDERRSLLERIPVGRFGSGQDVAAAVEFLTGEAAGYITGHVLWVTGGFDPLP